MQELVHRLRRQACLEDRLQLVEPPARVLGAAPGVLLPLVQPCPFERLPALLQENVD